MNSLLLFPCNSSEHIEIKCSSFSLQKRDIYSEYRQKSTSTMKYTDINVKFHHFKKHTVSLKSLSFAERPYTLQIAGRRSFGHCDVCLPSTGKSAEEQSRSSSPKKQWGPVRHHCLCSLNAKRSNSTPFFMYTQCIRKVFPVLHLFHNILSYPKLS